MKHIVCFSKGHSSALVAIEVVRRFGKENVILLNHDIRTGIEHSDIKRFGNEVADWLGMSITYANINSITDPNELPDQFDVLTSGFKRPGTDWAFCTHFLKTEPFTAYLKNSHRDQDVIIYYGFDKKEEVRKLRRQAIMGRDGWDTDYPLIDWEERSIESTLEIGIVPPLTYHQFSHANCTGCLKGGIQHWYVVYCTRYDVFTKAKATELRLGYSILKRQIPRSKLFRAFPLLEAEIIFERMKKANVPATEHYSKALFKQDLKRYGVSELSQLKPCECLL